MLMPVPEQDSEPTRSTDEENAPLSVLVVDAHPVVRMGISMLIAQDSGLRLVGEASSCAQTGDMLLSLRPDILVGDLMLEDGTACDLMEKMRAGGIAGQFVVYTTHVGEAHVLEALRAGASGYVVKNSTPQCLIDAIHTVARGDSYLDPAITSQVVGRLGRTHERRSSYSRELTKREATVLHSLALGKCNKEIAGELFITERTVKYHISHLFAKLRVKNRTQAVRAAVDQGLVSL